MDELRLHPCTKSNPTVKIWYIKGNGLKQVYKEDLLWDVIRDRKLFEKQK